MTEIGRFQTVP